MKLSKSSIGLLLVSSFLYASMVSAGDSCDPKLRLPESEICAEGTVYTQDKELNKIYHHLISVSLDKGALRQEQRQWLRTKRDACPDRDCLIKVYQVRVAELSDQLINAAPITDQPLSTLQAQKACGTMAEMASRESLSSLAVPGFNYLYFRPEDAPKQWSLSESEISQVSDLNTHYLQRMYWLRLGGDQQPTRFVSREYHGSAHSVAVVNVELVLAEQETAEDVSDPEELTRWARWGNREYPIYFQKHLFLISSDYRDLDDIKMISWLKPDGHSRPICMITPSSTRLLVETAKKPELCKRIADGRLPPLAWKDESERLKGDTKKRYGDKADRLGVLDIDLDGDGKTEKVGRLLIEWSGGTGGVWTRLALLSDDLSTSRKDITDEGIVKGGGGLNIYPWQGKFYISSRDSIIRWDGNKTEDVCQFKRQVSHKVSKVFEVSP